VLLIQGPAGIGKSELLGQVPLLAGEGAAVVLFARGSELECEVPYGVVRELLEVRVGPIVRVTRRLP
jgi:serine kinase of HPr protein (carbohydrate metabolism regulator)